MQNHVKVFDLVPCAAFLYKFLLTTTITITVNGHDAGSEFPPADLPLLHTTPHR